MGKRYAERSWFSQTSPRRLLLLGGGAVITFAVIVLAACPQLSTHRRMPANTELNKLGLPKGMTALIAAAFKGHTGVVKILMGYMNQDGLNMLAEVPNSVHLTAAGQSHRLN